MHASHAGELLSPCRDRGGVEQRREISHDRCGGAASAGVMLMGSGLTPDTFRHLLNLTELEPGGPCEEPTQLGYPSFHLHPLKAPSCLTVTAASIPTPLLRREIHSPVLLLLYHCKDPVAQLLHVAQAASKRESLLRYGVWAVYPVHGFIPPH